MRLLVSAAVLGLMCVSCTENPGAPPKDRPSAGPRMKGDPNIHEVHPDYPEAPPPNPRSNGRWMVYTIATDTLVEGASTRYYVTCWINSDASTFREVDISRAVYHEYRTKEDFGSIPCPG